MNMESSSTTIGARLSNDGAEKCVGRDYQTAECRGGGCKLGKEGKSSTLDIHIFICF